MNLEGAEKGYIKLFRKFQNHPFWMKNRRFSFAEAWLDLLFRANYKENKVSFEYQTVILKAGELITSQDKLASAWGWDRSTVRRFLKLLETDHQVTTEGTSKYTKISICNYEDYQSWRPAGTPATNLPKDQGFQKKGEKATSKRPANAPSQPPVITGSTDNGRPTNDATKDQRRTCDEPATQHREEVQEVQEGKEVQTNLVRSSFEKHEEPSTSKDRPNFERIWVWWERLTFIPSAGRGKPLASAKKSADEMEAIRDEIERIALAVGVEKMMEEGQNHYKNTANDKKPQTLNYYIPLWRAIDDPAWDQPDRTRDAERTRERMAEWRVPGADPKHISEVLGEMRQELDAGAVRRAQEEAEEREGVQ